MTNRALVEDWLKRAQSNLERAKAGKASDAILLEDLCFDCQQAVEKSIKAFLVHLNLKFEKIHSISRLLKQIEDTDIVVPDEIKETSQLTVYAVDTRYPGDYDPVTEEEYQLVLSMAERAVKWVEEKIGELKQAESENDHT